MTQRINPIGPYERRSMPVSRVERRKPTEDHHEPEERRDQFEEELERELQERERRAQVRQGEPAALDTPAVQVDLSTGTPPQSAAAGPDIVRERYPGDPDDPHIDVSA